MTKDNVRDIVVVGAALGGVTAIAKMASCWPAELPATVIVALVTPKQPAPMVLQILKGYAPVSVVYGKHGEVVKRGTIYLSPPGKHLLVRGGGVLQLAGVGAFEDNLSSIDRLFISAAAVYGRRLIGVVLSGEARGGAKGLEEIEAAGGIGIVQDPKEAAEPQLPRHVIENDSPHYCVKAGEIPALVKRLMAAPLD
ncbi:chemotaxis protein CheB [Variovorax sp. J22P168]|uniref:chemotaxis protein CheB n=1 Tax=Variovorax jilinensis TaxID=3053513 RepID=UPI002574E9EA|nr:chemotaxis protein CheB [Variovorax sp. J22P168]MDM0015489.1 chemotaxis protein CheB [Variovorax sp. J22P168]